MAEKVSRDRGYRDTIAISRDMGPLTLALQSRAFFEVRKAAQKKARQRGGLRWGQRWALFRSPPFRTICLKIGDAPEQFKSRYV